MAPADLAQTWRDRAEELAPYAPAAAEAFRAAAGELELALRAAEDEELTLAEAAKESGYSKRRIRELVAEGKLPNAGQKGAPRVRRGDLPRRRKVTSGTWDADEHVRSIAGGGR